MSIPRERWKGKKENQKLNHGHCQHKTTAVTIGLMSINIPTAIEGNVGTDSTTWSIPPTPPTTPKRTAMGCFLRK